MPAVPLYPDCAAFRGECDPWHQALRRFSRRTDGSDKAAGELPPSIAMNKYLLSEAVSALSLLKGS